jgi:hypothetical protein
LRRVKAAFLADAERAAAGLRAAALPPRRPPLRDEEVSFFVPRPEPAVVLLVDGRPRPALGLAVRDAAPLVALLDVLGLALLLARITRLVAARHDALLCGLIRMPS